MSTHRYPSGEKRKPITPIYRKRLSMALREYWANITLEEREQRAQAIRVARRAQGEHHVR